MVVKRKNLQNQMQEKYRKELLKDATVKEDTSAGGALVASEAKKVVFDLRKKDPRSVALEGEAMRVARLNRDLMVKIKTLGSCEEAQAVLDAHREELSYVTCCLLCSRIPFILESAVPMTSATAHDIHHIHPNPPSPPSTLERDTLLTATAALALHHCHSFQPQHYAQCAAGLAAAGHREPLFWRDLTRASSRRLATFSPAHLAVLCSAIAVSGFVPGLSWIQACDKQAARVMHSMSPEALSALVWCWGAWNHTPTKRIVDSVKMRLRDMIKGHRLGPEQLLQVLYGMARLTDHHPGERWLLGWANEFAPVMIHTHPAVLVEVLLSLVSLQFQPPQQWVGNIVRHLSRGLGLVVPKAEPQKLPEARREGGTARVDFTAAESDRTPDSSQRLSPEGGRLHLSRSVSQADLDPDPARQLMTRGLDRRPQLRSSGRPSGGVEDDGEVDEEPGDLLWETGSPDDDEDSDDYLEAEEEDGSFDDDDDSVDDDGSRYFRAEADQGDLGAGGAWDAAGEDDFGDGDDPLVMYSSSLSTSSSPGTAADVLDYEPSLVPHPDLMGLLLEQGQGKGQGQGQAGGSSGLKGDQPTASAQPAPVSASGSRSAHGSGSVTRPMSAHRSWRLRQQRLFELRPDIHLLGPSQLAQLSWCLDTLDYLPEERWMSALVSWAEACLEETGPAELADLLQGLAGIDFLPDDAFMSAVTARLHLLSPTMDAEPLRRSLRALMRLGARPPAACLAAMIERAVGLVSELGPVGLPDVLTAAVYLSGLSGGPREASSMGLLDSSPTAAGDTWRAPPKASSGPLADAPLRPGDATYPSSVVGERGDLASVVGELGNAVVSASLPLLPSLTADRLAALGWALAVTSSGQEGAAGGDADSDGNSKNNKKSVRKGLKGRGQNASSSQSDASSPRSIASGKSGGTARPPRKPPVEWLHEWLVCCRAALRRMDARDLATVAWASACLRHRPGPSWLEDYAREAGRRMESFDAQALTDVCWALASFGFTPTDAWIIKLEQELTRRCPSTPLNTANPIASTATTVDSGRYPEVSSLSSRQLAVVLWALEGFHWVPRTKAFVEVVEGAFIIK